MARSPFMKRVIIPFWAVHLALMLYFCIYYSRDEAAFQSYSSFSIRLLVYTIVCYVGVALEIAEIILFCCQRLKSFTYLVFQCIQTVIWLVMTLKAVVITVNDEDAEAPVYPYRSFDSPAIALVAIYVTLLFAFMATLIYASVIFHYQRCNKQRLPRSSVVLDDRINMHPLTENGIVPLPPPTTSHYHTAFQGLASHPMATTKDSVRTLVDNDSSTRVSADEGKPGTPSVTLTELPVRPPVPPYFERLSSIGKAQVGQGVREMYELAAMRNGRRGGIAVH